MTAITAALDKSNHKLGAQLVGPYGEASGARVRTIKITPGTSHPAGGDTIDLSTAGGLGTNGFKRRIYWATVINTSVNNGSNTYTQAGLVPGTAKTDKAGGYAPDSWKLQLSAGSTETTGDAHLYVVYAVVCGV